MHGSKVKLRWNVNDIQISNEENNRLAEKSNNLSPSLTIIVKFAKAFAFLFMAISYIL